MRNSFYSEAELYCLGLKAYGKRVLISKKVSIYSPETVELGDNVRIDDFCILSGRIRIGNNVHISAGVYLYGKSGIEIKDYGGCSANCIIYSETDDFSGMYMVGAVLPENLKNVKKGKVVLGKYAQLGAGTIVMPGIIINDGAVTGAMAFVKHDLEAWTINVGIPAKKIKNRSMNMLDML